ncbi:hypothetical protein B0H14DRAFT_2614923 [Mycena olivaceomarginata]|nr:hypothetical protein B0H14DRAFT_2614923 [Mycena olivaceomarginata]
MLVHSSTSFLYSLTLMVKTMGSQSRLQLDGSKGGYLYLPQFSLIFEYRPGTMAAFYASWIIHAVGQWKSVQMEANGETMLGWIGTVFYIPYSSMEVLGDKEVEWGLMTNYGVQAHIAQIAGLALSTPTISTYLHSLCGDGARIPPSAAIVVGQEGWPSIHAGAQALSCLDVSRQVFSQAMLALNTSSQDDASEDARPDKLKTVASSSSVKKENNKVPTKGKGKARRFPLRLKRAQRLRVLTVRTDTPLTPAEHKLYISQRHTARRKEAYQDADKANNQRVESGLRHAPAIADYWTREFERIANLETVRRSIHNDSGDLQFVQTIVNVFCRANNHSPIPPSSEVWNMIPPPTIDFLARLGEAPTMFDPAPFLANGTLVLSTSADPLPINVCQNYLRVVATSGETAKEAGLAYLYRYPADAPNTVLQLLLQVCAQRDKDDLAAGVQCRFVNFILANITLPYNVYHIPSLDTPTTSPLDLRTDPVISHKERILIALLSTSALNSSPGGNVPIFQPTIDMIHAHIRLTEDLPPLNFSLRQEHSKDLEKQIESLLDNEVRLLAPCQHTQMVPAAIQALKAKVASVLRLKHGRVVRLNITKDIPLEGMLGTCGRYWDATSNPVCAIIRSGDIINCANGLFPNAKHQFFVEGVSSPTLLDKFPADVRYRRTRGARFTDNIGRGLSHLGLYVPVGDAGRLKYDCHLARLRWEVDFLDWSNGEALKAWLLDVKAQAEGFLYAAGVTAALEVAKSRTRRAGGSLQGGTTRNYKRRHWRAAQLDAILTHVYLLNSLDLPPDPDHLAPYTHPILSNTFSSWFMGLKDGTDIVYAANALGRSDKAMKVIKLRTAKFVEIQSPNRAVNAPDSAEWHDSDIQYCYPACPLSAFVHGTLTISKSNFPDLERVLYVHDVLHDPASLILGDLAPVLADLKLV